MRKHDTIWYRKDILKAVFLYLESCSSDSLRDLYILIIRGTSKVAITITEIGLLTNSYNQAIADINEAASHVSGILFVWNRFGGDLCGCIKMGTSGFGLAKFSCLQPVSWDQDQRSRMLFPCSLNWGHDVLRSFLRTQVENFS
jgi:hypothetical protein